MQVRILPPQFTPVAARRSHSPEVQLSALLAVLGIVLVIASMLDALWTTLWLEGHSGPIASRLTRALHVLFIRVARRHGPSRTGAPNHRLLSLQGPLALVASVLTWLLIIWTGWVLAFGARPGIVVNTETRVPATVAERIYFVGYTMFTMGNGDFTPVGGTWQVATAIASLTGFGLLTLTITYLLSVLEAVVQKRSLASSIFAVGRSAEDFVIHAWNGRGFPGLEVLLMSVVERLSSVTEQHRTYPMLHYYHSTSEHTATPSAVALLSDALLLLRHGVASDHRPGPGVLRAGASIVGDYLATVSASYRAGEGDLPRPPDLGRLRTAGIPVVDQAAFDAAAREEERRRRLLRGLLADEGREWPPSGRDANVPGGTSV